MKKFINALVFILIFFVILGQFFNFSKHDWFKDDWKMFLIELATLFGLIKIGIDVLANIAPKIKTSPRIFFRGLFANVNMLVIAELTAEHSDNFLENLYKILKSSENDNFNVLNYSDTDHGKYFEIKKGKTTFSFNIYLNRSDIDENVYVIKFDRISNRHSQVIKYYDNLNGIFTFCLQASGPKSKLNVTSSFNYDKKNIILEEIKKYDSKISYNAFGANFTMSDDSISIDTDSHNHKEILTDIISGKLFD